QVALEQQPREVTVREGDEFTFQCIMKGDDMSNYFMYWYRQDARGSLEWINRDGGAYGDGFQDRFVGSMQTSKNSFTLQLVAASPGDAATYYCAARITLEHLSSVWINKLVFGPGTTLTVEPSK
uniref:Ig-like domain-containing protein n=1 Tax=Zonotrichia albicollis TaxID=44394 RepID=A0A8D2LZW7_ZONAL